MKIHYHYKKKDEDPYSAHTSNLTMMSIIANDRQEFIREHPKQPIKH